MSKLNFMAAAGGVLVMTALLAGCSSGAPSDRQISDAAHAEISRCQVKNSKSFYATGLPKKIYTWDMVCMVNVNRWVQSNEKVWVQRNDNQSDPDSSENLEVRVGNYAW